MNATDRYLDDFVEGETFRSSGVTLTEADIIQFAREFDPQPFHLDVNAASESIYGGLIASGFQTIALCFRLFIQRGLLQNSSMGSPGIDECRFLAPVRPGDTLYTENRVVEVIASRSRPDRGILRLEYRAMNQHGDAVAAFIVNHLLKRRQQAATQQA